MADQRIDRINSEVHSPGFEIKSRLLAEVLLDAIGPILFGPKAPEPLEPHGSRFVTEPTPRV